MDQKKVSHPFRAIADAALQRFSFDTLTETRLRIMGLYLIMGAIIVIGVGLFIYDHIVSIIVSSVTLVVTAHSTGTPIVEINTESIVRTIIAKEIQRLNLTLGLLIFFAIVIIAYFLSDALLQPMRREADARKKFTGNVSHELRTPLTIMKTNTEVMFAGAEPPAREELLEGLASSIEELDRMTNIVQFFLNFSMGKDWEKKIPLSAIDITAVTSGTIKSMSTLAKGKEVSLSMTDDGAAIILGDVTTLEEMLMNLIKNSIAYTPSGGAITVSLKHDRARNVVLQVKDTGIGILPKDLPKIFEPFFCGENAVSQRTKKKGSGIGLAIVKEIVDLHKGKIEVQSEIGNGTAISVRFPLLPTGA